MAPVLPALAENSTKGIGDLVNEYTEENEPLTITALKYEFSDFFALDGLLDDPYEEKLGIKIWGEPTADDLENLVRFTEKHLDKSWTELGIEEIIIFSEEDKERVDYIGKHKRNCWILNNQIWFFSGKVEEDHFVHELTHRRHKIKRKYSIFLYWGYKWNALAGPYDKVITKQERGLIGVKSYLDGTTTGPKWGYVRKYGGKNMKEDIATYVEEIVTNPAVFREVQNDFEIYRGKLELLLEAGFITNPQYEKALRHLEKAEEYHQKVRR